MLLTCPSRRLVHGTERVHSNGLADSLSQQRGDLGVSCVTIFSFPFFHFVLTLFFANDPPFYTTNPFTPIKIQKFAIYILSLFLSSLRMTFFLFLTSIFLWLRCSCFFFSFLLFDPQKISKINDICTQFYT